MRIDPVDDPSYRMVTFRWVSPETGRAPKDVLLRLHTITDRAWSNGNLSPYLMECGADGAWTTSLRLRADLRCTYVFYPDYEGVLRGSLPEEEVWYGAMRTHGVVTDPLNPLTFPALSDTPESSLLELPDAPDQPWCRRRTGTPNGQVTKHDFASMILGNTRPAWTYMPANSAGAVELPVVVLLDGDCWMDIGLTDSLDNLIAAGKIPPTVVVMVSSLDQETRNSELGGQGHRAFLRFLLEELMPWTHRHWPIASDPARTVIAGQSFGGLTAAYAGLHAPQRFGLVLSQSGSFWWPKDEEFDQEGRELIAEFVLAQRVPIKMYLEAGLVEWLILSANRHMRDVLRAKVYEVVYDEYHGGHDWACWRGSIADGLIALLGRCGD